MIAATLHFETKSGMRAVDWLSQQIKFCFEEYSLCLKAAWIDYDEGKKLFVVDIKLV